MIAPKTVSKETDGPRSEDEHQGQQKKGSFAEGILVDLKQRFLKTPLGISMGNQHRTEMSGFWIRSFANQLWPVLAPERINRGLGFPVLYSRH